MQSTGQLVKYHACKHFTDNGPTLLERKTEITIFEGFFFY